MPSSVLGSGDARYLLGVVDEEIELLQIAARTPAGRSTRLDTAYAALIDGLNTELADWMSAWKRQLSQDDCAVLAALGVSGILGMRFTTGLIHRAHAAIPDERYLAEWTAVIAARLDNFD
ncbi:hypothetical protein ACAG26_09560 [Mycobacterium sp. pUA109]|uniref:hypothetical protein n=1 Tax=Mycobacterium sp. pUA109 TaxID=3238982 RepID=UPI00351BDBA3